MKHILRAAPVILLLLLHAAPAGAHAAYESSDPSDGATVSSPPSQVEATFTEPVTGDSFLEVSDPCGEVVSGASQPIADTVTVSMDGTTAGTYTVFFRVQSSVDAHVTQGEFSFSSSGGDPCPGSEPPPDDGGGDGDGNGGGGGDGDGGGSDGDGAGTDPPQPGTNDGSSGGSGDPDGSTGSSGAPTGSGENGSNGSGSKRASNGGNGKGAANGGGSNGSGRNRGFETAGEEAPRRGPDPWDLPAGGLVAALTISALIGAAGGRIYASILGPRT